MRSRIKDSSCSGSSWMKEKYDKGFILFRLKLDQGKVG